MSSYQAPQKQANDPSFVFDTSVNPNNMEEQSNVMHQDRIENSDVFKSVNMSAIPQSQ